MFHGDGTVVVAPGLVDIVGDIDDLKIRQFLITGHGVVVFLTVYDHWPLHSVAHPMYASPLVLPEVIGPRQRWDELAESASVFHVTVGAVGAVEGLALQMLGLAAG